MKFVGSSMVGPLLGTNEMCLMPSCSSTCCTQLGGDAITGIAPFGVYMGTSAGPAGMKTIFFSHCKGKHEFRAKAVKGI